MRTLIFLISCILSFSVRAVETEISVLGLVHPDADISVAVDYLASIKDKWPSSSTGTSIKLLNNGIPLPFQSN